MTIDCLEVDLTSVFSLAQAYTHFESQKKSIKGLHVIGLWPKLEYCTEKVLAYYNFL
jgi:hypothetical protein